MARMVGIREATLLLLLVPLDVSAEEPDRLEPLRAPETSLTVSPSGPGCKVWPSQRAVEVVFREERMEPLQEGVPGAATEGLLLAARVYGRRFRICDPILVRCELHNLGEGPIRLPAGALPGEEIFDSHGKRIEEIFPPTIWPMPDDGRPEFTGVLPPGWMLAVVVDLAGVYGYEPPRGMSAEVLEPGTYTVRCRYAAGRGDAHPGGEATWEGKISSRPVNFEIIEAAPQE